MRTSEALQNGTSSPNINGHAPSWHVSISLKRRRKRLERLALIFHFTSGEHRLDDLYAFAHDGCGPDLFSLFSFTDFFHENF